MVVRRDDGPSRRHPGGDRELQEGHQPQQDEPGKIQNIVLRILNIFSGKRNRNEKVFFEYFDGFFFIF